jgi:hypothetical protein
MCQPTIGREETNVIACIFPQIGEYFTFYADINDYNLSFSAQL